MEFVERRDRERGAIGALVALCRNLLSCVVSIIAGVALAIVGLLTLVWMGIRSLFTKESFDEAHEPHIAEDTQWDKD